MRGQIDTDFRTLDPLVVVKTRDGKLEGVVNNTQSLAAFETETKRAMSKILEGYTTDMKQHWESLRDIRMAHRSFSNVDSGRLGNWRDLEQPMEYDIGSEAIDTKLTDIGRGYRHAPDKLTHLRARKTQRDTDWEAIREILWEEARADGIPLDDLATAPETARGEENDPAGSSMEEEEEEDEGSEEEV